MRSFLDVQKECENKINESRKVAIDNERLQLLGAIKREYGISDFKALTESERTVFTNIIHSMWSPSEGLNESGIKFVNEGEVTLNKESQKEEIKKFIESDFQRNFFGYLEGITGKRFTGNSNPKTPSSLREKINEMTGKNISPENFMQIFHEVFKHFIIDPNKKMF